MNINHNVHLVLLNMQMNVHTKVHKSYHINFYMNVLLQNHRDTQMKISFKDQYQCSYDS